MEISQFSSLLQIKIVIKKTNINAMEKLTLKFYIKKYAICRKVGSLLSGKVKLKSFQVLNSNPKIKITKFYIEYFF
jgi:hypothetical protein